MPLRLYLAVKNSKVHINAPANVVPIGTSGTKYLWLRTRISWVDGYTERHNFRIVIRKD